MLQAAGSREQVSLEVLPSISFKRACVSSGFEHSDRRGQDGLFRAREDGTEGGGASAGAVCYARKHFWRY